MNVCHGQGNLDSDGCCYVAGQVCPFRWKVVNGQVLDNTNAVIGTSVASAVVSKIGGPKPKRDKIVEAIGPRVFVCSLAAKYEGDWDQVHADAGYQAQVRPAWSQVEQDTGLAPNSYNCGTWGPGTNQCCYGEDPVTNAAKAVWLTAVSVRIDIGKKAQS